MSAAMDGIKTLLLHGAKEFATAEQLLVRLLKDRPHDRFGAAEWNEQYRSGHWNFLDGLSEAARHAVVAEWRERLKPGGAILEIGCGAGQLCKLLRRTGYQEYLGIDIAEAAVAAASTELGDTQTRFIPGDASAVSINGLFDTIILNEVLNYFPAPRALMRQLHGKLLPGGIILVSMAQCELREGLAKLRIWRDIASDHDIIEEVSLHRHPWPIWIIKAMRPKV